MTDTERAELALAVARRMGKPSPQVAHIWPMGSRCLLGNVDPENPEAAIFDPTVPGADAWEALEWLKKRLGFWQWCFFWQDVHRTRDLPLAVCRAIVEVGQ